jgi:plasmid rolling circle replication initiator protein Rep
MKFEPNNYSDRELLLMVLQKQDTHSTQHQSLVDKVERIEYKIIEDIENRVRLLENDKNKRKGAYQFWLIVVGVATFLNTVISIKGGW